MKTAASTRRADAWRCRLLTLLLAFAAGPALAHKASDAYLQIEVGERTLSVRWDVALRDLDAVLELDGDGDRLLTWGELRAALPRIEAHVAPRLAVDGCAPQVTDRAFERRSDGAYVALTLQAACTPAAGLPLRYTLFADSDVTHRGIAHIRHADGRRELRLLDPVANAPRATPPSSFVLEGVRHILSGYDHLLFLSCLVLPVALRREARAARQVAGIVTLFTAAHSLTLALAALGHVRLPPSLVEPAIALTIVAAALDNLRPLFGRWRAAVTFAFGLVHGFGFAGVLQELMLAGAQLGWALFRFNLGIELGQLAVLAAAAPLLHLVGANPARRQRVLHAGSLAMALMAFTWFVERGAAAVANAG